MTRPHGRHAGVARRRTGRLGARRPVAGQYHLERRFLPRHDRLGRRGRRFTRHRSGHLALGRGRVLRIIATGSYRTPGRDEVLAGWQQAAGRPAEHVAYWDAAAALCTVGDMGYCPPGDMLGEVGRPDLKAALLTARRDAFLDAALDELGSW